MMIIKYRNLPESNFLVNAMKTELGSRLKQGKQKTIYSAHKS